MDEKRTGEAPLRVRVYPDEVLRRLAAPVGRDSLGEELARLTEAMAATMYAEAGIGLAAPQVGVSLRLVVIDPSEERNSLLTLVNPVIVDAAGRDVAEEGCLSVPGVRAKVRRYERVTVEYETPSGEKTGLEAEGLAARVIQHELDHLDGALFVDKLGPAGRLAVRKALRELEQAYRSAHTSR